MKHLNDEIKMVINGLNQGSNCDAVTDALKHHLFELLLSKREVMVTCLSDDEAPKKCEHCADGQETYCTHSNAKGSAPDVKYVSPPEGSITDWRDLKVGDIVDVIKVTSALSNDDDERQYEHMHGQQLEVADIAHHASHQQVKVENKCCGYTYIDKWRFIRRP